jgi:hypothetical protein
MLTGTTSISAYKLSIFNSLTGNCRCKILLTLDLAADYRKLEEEALSIVASFILRHWNKLNSVLGRVSVVPRLDIRALKLVAFARAGHVLIVCLEREIGCKTVRESVVPNQRLSPANRKERLTAMRVSSCISPQGSGNPH